ncbi:MAG TPA: RnfABCDGE type electron transport complex subunit G [Eubacteriaceae bacterium]|jgi:electron transport complex protein RnfG|nr:RnfABCDGE type electron transport complex subunit G [Eubacteriaceae bacterium]
MREIIKLAGILFAITAIAGVLLGLTNMATADKIEQQLIQENINARKAVLPQATEFKKVEDEELDSIVQKDFQMIEEIYEGINEGELIGYTFKTTPSGYGGQIVVNVGISLDGTVSGINIVSHTETPGLGAKATEESYQDQYKEKSIDSPLEVVKSTPSGENEIQAIAGATVTSNGVTDGVNIAIDLFNQYLK